MIPVTRETLASVPPKREPRHLGGSKRRGPGALGPGGHSQSKGPLIITSVAFGRSIEHERIICEVLGRHLVRAGHHFECINLAVAASATRAWLVGIAAHPATQATMKAAALTANNVLAI